MPQATPVQFGGSKTLSPDLVNPSDLVQFETAAPAEAFQSQPRIKVKFRATPAISSNRRFEDLDLTMIDHPNWVKVVQVGLTAMKKYLQDQGIDDIHTASMALNEGLREDRTRFPLNPRNGNGGNGNIPNFT